MELFGLKDENGRDVKLVITDDPLRRVHPHLIISVEIIESEIETRCYMCDGPLEKDNIYGKCIKCYFDEFKDHNEPKELPKTVDELALLLEDFDSDASAVLTPWEFLEDQGYINK